MTSAREEILGRIRRATADVATGPKGATPPDPGTAPTRAARTEMLDLFVETVADYRAEVLRVGEDELAGTVAETLREHGRRSVIVPDGVDDDWTSALDGDVEIRRDSPSLTAGDLDHVDAVLTASAVGIATTGTIILDHRADQGRRALTLVPDMHVCVVRADQVVHDVPDAVARLRPDADRQPLTWISGPSATSDIELERVEGVHGPRTLVVVLVGV